MQAVGALQHDIPVKHPEIGPGGGQMKWPIQLNRQRQPFERYPELLCLCFTCNPATLMDPEEIR